MCGNISLTLEYNVWVIHMEDIQIREMVGYDEGQVCALYESVGWRAYTRDPDNLKKGVMNSLCVLGAYEDEKLVGLIRAVGDAVTIVFIQDILVHPAYQRRGIGRALVARLLERYRNVRQIHLLTDDIPETVGFYKAVGFTPVELIHAKAFTRLKY